MHYISRRLVLVAGLTLGLLGVGACDQELPTEVGGEHLPEAGLRTYEVLLDDLTFLVSDSLLRGFGTSGVSSLLLVAQDWRDTLDAHALVRFGDFPEAITFVDSTGTRTDTILRYIEGRIVVRVDTVALGLDTLGTDTTIAFDLFTVAESFDPRTATWTARSVAGGDSVFWTTPGGTPGTLIGSGSWTRGDTVAGDSVIFVVDSATIAGLATAEEDARGVMLTTTTPGARVQVLIPRLTLIGRPKNDPDTTRTASAVVTGQTYVFDPPPPEPLDEIRLGGRSAFRGYLFFQDGLAALTVPCPDGPAGCEFRLGDVTINRAELLLSPLPVSALHLPLVDFAIEARPVLGGESLPLERAPLGDTTGVTKGVSPQQFDGVNDSTVRVTVTRFVRGLLTAGTDTAVTDRDRSLALLTAPEPIPFGIVRFHGAGAFSGAPILRLIVTVPPREEDQ